MILHRRRLMRQPQAILACSCFPWNITRTFLYDFFYCSWGDVLRDRVKCYIDFNWVLTYCSGCSIDIFIYFHCLKTYISPFLVFICQKIIRISIDIIFTFICILACPFLFLSAYYTLQKWGSGKVSI